MVRDLLQYVLLHRRSLFIAQLDQIQLTALNMDGGLDLKGIKRWSPLQEVLTSCAVRRHSSVVQGWAPPGTRVVGPDFLGPRPLHRHT
jgi:hypothetical protein